MLYCLGELFVTENGGHGATAPASSGNMLEIRASALNLDLRLKSSAPGHRDTEVNCTCLSFGKQTTSQGFQVMQAHQGIADYVNAMPGRSREEDVWTKRLWDQ